MFLENSCMFINKQMIPLNGTIGMEVNQLYIVLLKRSWDQNVLTAYQGDGKVTNAKQITFIHHFMVIRFCWILIPFLGPGFFVMG